jgi:hypothetical protein
MVLAGLLAIGMTNALAVEQKSPAMQAYDRLSAARDQAEAVRKDGKDTPASRQQAEVILLKALSDTRSPEISSLAEGNRYLRFRSYNIRDDLFLLYVDEGDKAKALDMMAANVAQDPQPIDSIFRSDKAKALLKDEPRYKDMLQGMDSTCHTSRS